MSKSALYMVNSTSIPVAAGGLIPLGTITRRVGTAIRSYGDAITFLEPGYYEVHVNTTVQPDAADTITLTVRENDTALPGATVTATPATIGDSTPLQIPDAVVRVFCRSVKTLTFVLSAAATVTNAAVTIVKV